MSDNDVDALPTMKVRCNPGHALDHKGEGAAAVPFEGDRGVLTRWIGAEVDHERSKKLDRHVFEFAPERDVEVPVTAYYTRKLAHEELLPAPTCKVANKFAPVKKPAATPAR